MTYRRFQVGFDLHGDQQDEKAVEVFFKFAEIWKPDIRVCGGDLFDLRPLRKGASEDEKRESIRADINAGKKWLERFKATHYLRGNHCERLWDLARNGVGLTADLAHDGTGEVQSLLDSLDCKMLPYDKRLGVLRLGHLKIIHGFACGIYAARQTALVYGSTLFGHVHTIDEHSIPGLERRVARACGCLCLLSMDYNSRQPNTLRQAHGFPYGVVDTETGNYHIWQAEEVDGKWMLPTDFAEFSV